MKKASLRVCFFRHFMIIFYGVRIMFFKTKETIPEGMGFSTFGSTHIIWLLCFALVFAFAIVLYRRLSLEKRNVMRTVLGCVIVAFEIIKNIVAAAIGDFGIGHLPFHLCGISILLIGFDIIKQTKTVRQFLYYIGIAGAMLAIIFPNWTVLPCANFFHIHSFTIHALIVVYPLLLVTGGEVKPDIRTMPKCILLLIGLAIPIYFINLIFDTNFMFLMSPDKGNPLELFEKLLGSHLWGFPILLPIVMFIMYLPIFISAKLKKKPTYEKEKITV